MIELQEAKRRLEEINATLDKEISYYHPMSLYGFSIEKGEKVKYKNNGMISTHLLLARHVIDIKQASMPINLEILKISFNPGKDRNQIAMTKKNIFKHIIELTQEGFITIRFIENKEKEFSKQTLLNNNALKDELKEKLNSNELFTFTQTLVYSPHNEEKPMFFRVYEHIFQRLITNEAFEIMQNSVGNKAGGVSAKFDYLTVYAIIASSLNAPHKDEEYIESNVETKSGIGKIKRHIELLNSSVNYSGQEHLASRTTNNSNPKKKNIGIGVDRINKIDQSLRRDFGIFAHVKVRRYGSEGYKWTIYRCFAHEFDILKKMLELEIEKTYYEIIKYGEPKDNSITDVLPLEYLDNQNKYKVAEYKSSFDLEEFLALGDGIEENPFAKVERLQLEDKKKSLDSTRDKENGYENNIQDNYNIQETKCKQEKLHPFSKFMAQEKVTRIYDEKPYEIQDEKFDKLINEVCNLIK